jgi:hypothetical protein
MLSNTHLILHRTRITEHCKALYDLFVLQENDPSCMLVLCHAIYFVSHLLTYGTLPSARDYDAHKQLHESMVDEELKASEDTSVNELLMPRKYIEDMTTIPFSRSYKKVIHVRVITEIASFPRVRSDKIEQANAPATTQKSAKRGRRSTATASTRLALPTDTAVKIEGKPPATKKKAKTKAAPKEKAKKPARKSKKRAKEEESEEEEEEEEAADEEDD